MIQTNSRVIIIMRFVSFVAVLTSLAFLPETESVSLRPGISTLTPSTTFNPKGTSCELKTCPPGRQCALDENNEATCVCDIDCFEDYYEICGSDNKTYLSYCELKREACRTNTNLTVISYEACNSGDSLCAGITCPSNRECAVADGLATCVCIQTCPMYSSPVCGSDNQTYLNDCDLKRGSCVSKENVTIAYSGQCKQETVCDGVRCPKGTECAVDEHQRPVCVCILKCPYTTNIVCGSDDRTYGNECELQKEACYANTSIRIVNKGFCLKGSVCNGHRCPPDQLCTVDQNNRPVCVCNDSCPNDSYDPVCGSDGRPYYNLCYLKREACYTPSSNLTMARAGPCSYDDFCIGVVCPRLKTCVVDAENQTSCVCNYKCDTYYSPVCGSDNKTYDSYCHLYDYNCQTNSRISINYYAVCSEGSNCEGISCRYGMHCDSQHQAEPKCVCDTVCPKTYYPVCGSNNHTYNNTCELQRDACLTNTSIFSQHDGRCEEGFGCTNFYCPYGRTCVVDDRGRPMCVCSQNCYSGVAEICGSDDKTYSNECFLAVATCLTNNNITIQHKGQCKDDNPCKDVVCSSERYCVVGSDGRPICVCNEECTSSGSPVCGSDNKTYSTICELRKHSCLSSSSIHWLYYGKCVEASVCDRVPCPPEKRCAIDERNQPTCVCIDECLNIRYPVCGSDGRTYGNECELQRESCLSNRNVTLNNRGKCDIGLTCSDIYCPSDRECAVNEMNQPTCVCKTDCSSYSYSPVCGTDGTMYNNTCDLERTACTTNKNIEVDHDGSCRNGNPLPSSTAKQCIGRRCAADGETSTTTTTTTTTTEAESELPTP